MGEMAEDRIYADRLGKTDVYVATGLGVAVVSVSNDRIGQFSLTHRCEARDVAADGDRLLAATEADVLVTADPQDGEYRSTGFGPAVAVGAGPADGGPVAAGSDGTVARYDGTDWTALGEVADPRALDGDLLAAGNGVYRIDGGLDHVGLDDARDVAVGGAPLAATGEGCYRLGPGWTRDIEGAFETVASHGERAHAATNETLYERTDGEWAERSVPVDEPVADLTTTDDGGLVAVTTAGTCLVDPVAAKDGAEGWRHRSLGLPDVTAMAVLDA
jgi:hypothetical protein